MSVLFDNRWVAPITIGSALTAGLFGGGLSLSFAAAAGVVTAIAIRTPGLRDIAANKAAIALGCITFALFGADMKFGNNIPSFGFSLLMESLEHQTEFMLAGFAGLFASSALRGELWDSRTRPRYQTISRQMLGTAFGIAGYLAGSLSGAYASGSKLFNVERLNSILNNPNEGFSPAFWESQKQVHAIMMKTYNILRENLEGAQSIRERFNDAVNKVGAGLDKVFFAPFFESF